VRARTNGAERNVQEKPGAARRAAVASRECDDIASGLEVVSFGDEALRGALEVVAMGSEWKTRSVPVEGGHPRERILVAEGDLGSAERIQELLELEGFQVAIATNGAGALREAQAFQPKTILLDLQLCTAGVDGVEVCRRIKAGAQSAARIIAIAGSTKRDERQLRDAGFDAVIYRPLRLEVLLERLSVLERTMLERSDLERSAVLGARRGIGPKVAAIRAGHGLQ
jgi:CheY-like chemotaxis protein